MLDSFEAWVNRYWAMMIYHLEEEKKAFKIDGETFWGGGEWVVFDDIYIQTTTSWKHMSNQTGIEIETKE